MPLASRTQSKPSRRKSVGVAAAADRDPLRLEAGAAQARLGEAQRRRGRRQLVAAEELFDPHVDVAAVLARAPGAGVGDLPRRPRRRAPASRLRASAWMPQCPGTTLPEVPPLIRPTLAVVSSSSRPSSIRAIAAAAAAIALLPSSGRIPAWASTPTKSARIFCWVGVGDDHLADRPGVVEDEAASRAQRRGVEGLGAAQPLLLGDGQDQLDPDRRRRLRVRARPAP